MHRSRLAVALIALATLSLNAGTVVQFRTVLGDVEVELYDAQKPITSTNFVRYVADGAYRDMFFHRAVPNFVIQGGGFRVANPGTPSNTVANVTTRANITNEYGVGPFFSNVAGTIAMAKTADPNSANSQFFINLQNNTSLDSTANSGGFTVFGRVISGTNTLSAWNSFTRYVAATTPTNAPNLIVNAGSPFGELPLLKLATRTDGTRFVSLDDLIYCDVTLLRVRVRNRQDGLTEVTWNPVAGRTNYVEYTTEFPPKWQSLTNLPPSAIPATVYSGPDLPNNSAPKTYPTAVVDPSGDPNRFYRVRATY